MKLIIPVIILVLALMACDDGVNNPVAGHPHLDFVYKSLPLADNGSEFICQDLFLGKNNELIVEALNNHDGLMRWCYKDGEFIEIEPNIYGYIKQYFGEETFCRLFAKEQGGMVSTFAILGEDGFTEIGTPFSFYDYAYLYSYDNIFLFKYSWDSENQIFREFTRFDGTEWSGTQKMKESRSLSGVLPKADGVYYLRKHPTGRDTLFLYRDEKTEVISISDEKSDYNFIFPLNGTYYLYNFISDNESYIYEIKDDGLGEGFNPQYNANYFYGKKNDIYYMSESSVYHYNGLDVSLSYLPTSFIFGNLTVNEQYVAIKSKTGIFVAEIIY